MTRLASEQNDVVWGAISSWLQREATCHLRQRLQAAGVEVPTNVTRQQIVDLVFFHSDQVCALSPNSCVLSTPRATGNACRGVEKQAESRRIQRRWNGDRRPAGDARYTKGQFTLATIYAEEARTYHD